MTLLTDAKLKTLPVGLMNLMAAQKSAVQYGQMYAGLVIVMLSYHRYPSCNVDNYLYLLL